MTAIHAQAYNARLLRVLNHIETHLIEDLSVEALSNVAAFSKFHFHRQFAAVFGIGVYRYVQLARLKRASHKLAFRDEAVTGIALDSGYDGPEAFARAFKRTLGQSPSAFREQPDWAPWHDTFAPLQEIRAMHLKQTFAFKDVEIRDVPDIRITEMIHHGSPQKVGDTIRRFIDWRKANNLPPQRHATYSLFYADPLETPPEDYRIGLGVATDRDFTGEGLVANTLPKGRAAVLRFTGFSDDLRDVVSWLYAQWLPQSGEELRDFPIYVQRVKFFPEVAENEAVTDIFLPLK